MSETRSKKTKRKKKNANAPESEPPCTEGGGLSGGGLAGGFPLSSEALEETLFWYHTGSDDKSQTMELLRLEVLSPYLFSKPLLCDKAVSLCLEKELLPMSGILPQFFDRSHWIEVTALAKVMAAVQAACDVDDLLYQDVLAGGGTLSEADPGLIQRLKHHSASGQLRNISDSQIDLFYEVIAIQGLDFTSRVHTQENLATTFLDNLKNKVKFADAIKVRANANFKHENFKAAIADYNKAIALCPYNSVLYHNRALCFLSNQEFWYACVDSFRALVLYPIWEKPYYRCAEAWHLLGDLSHAIEINLQGQVRCSSNTHLRSQLSVFIGGPESRKSHSIVSTKETESLLSPVSKPLSGGSKKKASKELTPTTSSNDHDLKRHSTNTTLDHDKKSVKESNMPAPTLHDQEKKSKALDQSKKNYTELEELHCPELDPRLTCSELRKLCHHVKLEWCSPAAYFSAAGSKWEALEPEWVDPPLPSTDPSADHEPMLAKFDEIWCPVLADMEENLSIIPPTFQYFSDGTIMHATAY